MYIVSIFQNEHQKSLLSSLGIPKTFKENHLNLDLEDIPKLWFVILQSFLYY